jgi:hypothetical protein
MASNINANNIDGTYPVAGVDNDSQGFRTNFTNIKNNLAYAKTELEDLQSKAVLKSALTGGSLNNSMNGAVISAAEIKDFRETEVDLGSVSGSITLDHATGHHYKVTTSGSISVAFVNLPVTGKVGRIRLKVVVTDPAHTLTLPSAVSLGTSSIQGYSANVITFAAADTYIVEFTTDDQGSTIHIQDLTRGRNKITQTTDSTSTTTGAFTVAGGVGIAGNLYVGGNVVVTGDIIPSFTWSNIAPAGTTTSTSDTLLLSSSGTIAAETIYFPPSTTAKNGETVTVASNVAITSLTLTSNGATISGTLSSIAANGFGKWVYVASALKWFRIG